MRLRGAANGELIGLDVNVVGRNISGKVVDETKNSILIETKKGERKTAMKMNNTFEFALPEGKIAIDGKDISGRAEDRIKKKAEL